MQECGENVSILLEQELISRLFALNRVGRPELGDKDWLCLSRESDTVQVAIWLAQSIACHH